MSEKDVDMIERVIHINKDASQFFKAIQQSADSFELKGRMAALYEIHRNIVQNLKIHLTLKENKDQHTLEDELKVAKNDEIFNECFTKLDAKSDHELIGQIEAAENQCEGMIKSMVKDGEVLKSTKEVIARQMLYLKKSFEYFKSLKSI